MPLRILAWNVNMALRRKWPALNSLRADIAVLPEVAHADLPEDRSEWVGHLPNKGLGVVVADGWTIRRHPAWDPRIEFVVPYQISGPVEFLLFATWAMFGRAVNQYPEAPKRGQLLQALDVYDSLLTSSACVVAGDFNNGVVWDKPGRVSNHSSAVARLEEFGLASSYHLVRGSDQGQEPEPTLYWKWNRQLRYHIDYVFIPSSWQPAVRSIEVGSFEEWVQPGVSDHVPVVVELDSGALAI